MAARITAIGDGAYLVELTERSVTVFVAQDARGRWVFCDGQVFKIPDERAITARRGPRGTDGGVTSPMPAKVVNVLAVVGTEVRRGDVLVILEAMKMELPIAAPRDATVLAIHCRAGEVVQPDMSLVDLQSVAE